MERILARDTEDFRRIRSFFLFFIQFNFIVGVPVYDSSAVTRADETLLR